MAKGQGPPLKYRHTPTATTFVLGYHVYFRNCSTFVRKKSRPECQSEVGSLNTLDNEEEDLLLFTENSVYADEVRSAPTSSVTNKDSISVGVVSSLRRVIS